MMLCPPGAAPVLDNFVRRWIHQPAHIFAGLVQPGMNVADVGCATGTFTFALEEFCAPSGQVFAIDVQQEMLDRLARKLAERGQENRIHLHRSGEQHLNLPAGWRFDFANLFWMLHEAKNGAQVMADLGAAANPAARLLLAEPGIEVNPEYFQMELDWAARAGWQVEEERRIAFSRAVVLRRAG